MQKIDTSADAMTFSKEEAVGIVNDFLKTKRQKKMTDAEIEASAFQNEGNGWSKCDQVAFALIAQRKNI